MHNPCINLIYSLNNASDWFSFSSFDFLWSREHKQFIANSLTNAHTKEVDNVHDRDLSNWFESRLRVMNVCTYECSINRLLLTWMYSHFFLDWIDDIIIQF